MGDQLNSTTLDGASYTYDNAGNRLTKTDQLAAVTSNYGYDAVYQLLQSTAQDDPGNWCKQAMSRIRDWMGAGIDDQDFSEWRKTKLARALSLSAQKVAEQWDQRITKEVYDLMAFPGARVAGGRTLHQVAPSEGRSITVRLTQQISRAAIHSRILDEFIATPASA